MKRKHFKYDRKTKYHLVNKYKIFSVMLYALNVKILPD